MAKMRDLISELVASLGSQLAADGGCQTEEKAETQKWVQVFETDLQADSGASKKEAVARALNDHLAPRVYVAGGCHPSMADVCLYAGLHGFFKSRSDEERFELCNLSRWFNFIQHKIGAKSLDRIDVNLNVSESSSTSVDNVQVEVAKKPAVDAKKPANDKSQKAKAQQVSSTVKPSRELTPEQQAAKEAKKKAKADKNKKKAAKKSQVVPDILKLDLRVGKILSAKLHPNDPEKLFVENVDIGGDKPICVVSGFAQHLSLDQVTGRLCVLALNLAVADIKGVTSVGRIFSASDPEKGFDLVNPPEESKVGEQITFGEWKPDCGAQLNDKKFKKILKQLACNDGVVRFADMPLTTTAGPCTSNTDGAVK